MKYTWIGFIATITSAMALVPTVYNVSIVKRTRGINYLYVALGFTAQILWLIYALINKDLPVAILATYLMIVYITIALSKWRYESEETDVYSQLEKKFEREKARATTMIYG